MGSRSGMAAVAKRKIPAHAAHGTAAVPPDNLLAEFLRQWGRHLACVICNELVSSNCCSNSQPLTRLRALRVGIPTCPAAQRLDYRADISTYMIYLRFSLQ
jgi:hypothetical protein